MFPGTLDSLRSLRTGRQIGLRVQDPRRSSPRAKIRSVIPVGQAILAAHYSAGRVIRYRNRAWSPEGKRNEAQQMATRHARQAGCGDVGS